MTYNPRRGSMRSERPLRDILGPEEARRMLASAAAAGAGGGTTGGTAGGSRGGRGGGSGGGGASQHPADRLIRELLQSGRQATAAEVEQILERMVSAPFNTASVRVPPGERGTSYQGRTLGASAPSIEYHLAKRVVIEQQWAPGTTAAEYLEDLRRAIRDPAARLAVYGRWGDHLAATVTPTGRVLDAARQGPRREAQLFVVYSADRGMIVTGYQFSTLAAVGIPAGARWLK